VKPPDVHTPDDERMRERGLGDHGWIRKKMFATPGASSKRTVFATYATPAICISRPRIHGR
jgi:hypothetical protein